MSGWIFCDDVEPPVNLDVLLYVVRTGKGSTILDEFMATGCYNGKYFDSHGGEWEKCEVIAWTLLPSKPWKEIYEKGKADLQ
jgi:hypothetical protein